MHDKQFTAGARGALRLAQAAAGELGHSYVGSEHLLLGILQTEGPARCCLQEQAVTPEKLRLALRQLVGAGSPGLAPVQGLTPRARRIIESAAGESARRGGGRIGPEHLLLGILRESEAVAVQALRTVGADPGRLQAALIRRMGGGLRPQRETLPRPPAAREEAPRARVLEQFTRSLSTLAREGRLDPVLGREREIARIIRILSRRTKNNPVLLGEPGVGKTAVVEGLAQRIAAGEVPGELLGLNILSIDLAAMLAGTKYRGEFEERLRSAVQEVRRLGNVVLFIDELHNIVGAGSAEGAVDAANLLKPALSRGELRVIGATTLEEYRRHIERDAALERRFQPVTVEEPSPETAVAILEGLRERYEAHHGLAITDGALRAAVSLSRRYLPERFLPDKAIDLMDEACSRVRLERQAPEPELRLLEERLAGARRDKERAAARQDFERAAALRDAEEDFARQLREERRRQGDAGAVTEEDIAAVTAEWTGVPVSRVTESESQRLLGLEEALHRRVVGQEEAVSCLCRAVRRGRVGLQEPGRPVGSFLLLGPTGVGKTEVCRALAQAVFGREDALIRFDMSEYAESHTASRLVGAPPGYVGHDDGGQLTERIRRRPWSLVLFDEIEKAHQDVWNLLLQVMEEGCLTDSHGRKVDFRNTIIAMTSNVGARHVTGGGGAIGFAASAGNDGGRRAVEAELKGTFRPEFLNRVDEVVLFRPLAEADLREIARRMLAGAEERLQTLGLSLVWEEEALSALARESFDRTYGARPLRRLIRGRVEDPIAEGLLSGAYRAGERLILTAEGGTAAVKKAP